MNLGDFLPVAEGTCQFHRDCEAVLLNVHHYPPLSWSPTSPRTIRLCPTAHVNQHALLDEALRRGGDVKAIPWAIRRRWSRRARALAADSFAVAREQGLTPKPTL